MATHLPPVDYDDTNRRIARHEKETARTLAAFAVAVAGAAAIWLAFYHYL